MSYPTFQTMYSGQGASPVAAPQSAGAGGSGQPGGLFANMDQSPPAATQPPQDVAMDSMAIMQQDPNTAYQAKLGNWATNSQNPQQTQGGKK